MEKDSNKNRSIGNMILDTRKSVSNIKNHSFFKNEFEPNRIKSVFRRLELFFGILVIVILITLLVILPPLTQANVAIFHPETCLGEWENTGNAQGEPSLSLDEALAEDFTKDNSASLRGTAQIYCGDFKGEIPQKSIPTKMTIRLAWSVDDGHVIHRDPVPVVVEAPIVQKEKKEGVEGAVDAVLEIINSNIEVPNVYPDLITPPVESPAVSETVEVAPAEPVSETPNETPLEAFLHDLFSQKVYAQEEAPAEQVVVGAEEPAPVVVSEITVADPIPTKEISIEESPSETAPELPVKEDVIAESVIIPIESNFSTIDTVEGFMEVLYTSNGTDWNSLGIVGRNNWRNISFDIPVSEWVNLSKLQVTLRPIANIDPYPVVYLDAMILDVYYDEDEDKEPKELWSVIDIVAKSDDLGLEVKGGFKDPIQLVIGTKNGTLGNLAVFNAETSLMVLNTWTDEPTYVVDPSYLGAGKYVIIKTQDPDSCSVMTLEQCVSASDTIGTVSFVIIKNDKPAIVIEEPVLTKEDPIEPTPILDTEMIKDDATPVPVVEILP